MQKTQNTIEKTTRLTGYGLFSGKPTFIELQPAKENSGIVFINQAQPKTHIKLSPANILKHTHSSTSLIKDTSIVKTVEHFLAVLHIYGINNLIVLCEDELPNIDGSARDFCSIIEAAGIKEQETQLAYLQIDEKLIFGNTSNTDETFMEISPYDGFCITLSIDFPKPIGKQSYTYAFESPIQFKNEIAPARSFNTLENINIAKRSGLVDSDIFDSHIIIDKNEVINTKLRFEDEFVRHKILDIIGDLYILGVPLKCKINANKTSHKFNHRVVASLTQKYATIV